MRQSSFWMFGIIALLLCAGFFLWRQREPPPIRVGILHSLTGAMGSHERPLVDALKLAIEETNQSGGLLGRRVEAVVADCRSAAAYCGQQAERLITQEKVSALFGCWTSSCRKAVKPAVEKYQHLLFYPLQYEGMEQSPNIIYLGAAPNQQLIPAIRWALDNLGKRFYLIGSDYVFPRTARVMTGRHAVWNYFQSIPGAANQRFVAAIQKRYGKDRVTNDPMEVSYVGLKLWHQAVQEAGSDDPARVNITILKQSMAAPEGIVSLSLVNRHLWRNVNIGQAKSDGQFDILWSSASPVRPELYPTYRNIDDWEELLREAGLR